MKGSNSDKDVDFIGPKLMSRQGKLSSSTWKSVISSAGSTNKTSSNNEKPSKKFRLSFTLSGKNENSDDSDDDSNLLPEKSTSPPLLQNSESPRSKGKNLNGSINSLSFSGTKTDLSQSLTSRSLNNMSSSFLAPGRGEFFSPEMKELSKVPGVGQYSPNYQPIDSEKFTYRPSKSRPSPSTLARSYNGLNSSTSSSSSSSSGRPRALSLSQVIPNSSESSSSSSSSSSTLSNSNSNSAGSTLRLSKDYSISEVEKRGSLTNTSNIHSRPTPSKFNIPRLPLLGGVHNGGEGGSGSEREEGGKQGKTGKEKKNDTSVTQRSFTAGAVQSMKREGLGNTSKSTYLSARMAQATLSHTQRLRTANLDESKGGPSAMSSSFKSHTEQRPPFWKESDCSGGFYAPQYDVSKLEVDSQHPRQKYFSLPLPKVGREGTASTRGVTTSVDASYNSAEALDRILTRPSTLADLGRTTGRSMSTGALRARKRGGGEAGEDTWVIPGSVEAKGGEGGAENSVLYSGDDSMLSKRKHMFNCSLSHQMGTPAPSPRMMLPHNEGSTSTEEHIDLVAVDALTRPRHFQGLSFGHPSSSPYLITDDNIKRKNKKVPPWATVDEEGNPLPTEFVISDPDRTHPRAYSQVPFGSQTARQPMEMPMTIDLDYQADTTAGIGVDGKEVEVDVEVERGGGGESPASVRTREFSFGASEGAGAACPSPPTSLSPRLTQRPRKKGKRIQASVAPSLLRMYERNIALNGRGDNTMSMSMSMSGVEERMGGVTERSFNHQTPSSTERGGKNSYNNTLSSYPMQNTTSASATLSSLTSSSVLPRSLTTSSLYNPPASDFTLLSAGTRQHVYSISFDSYPTREQADPNRYNDVRVDKFYNVQRADNILTHPKVTRAAKYFAQTSSSSSSTATADTSSQIVSEPFNSGMCFVNLKKTTSRKSRVISHEKAGLSAGGVDTSKLNYHPNMNAILPHRPSASFSNSQHNRKPLQDNNNPLPPTIREQEIQNLKEMPFYDKDYTLTKPSIRQVSIAPVPTYGL